MAGSERLSMPASSGVEISQLTRRFMHRDRRVTALEGVSLSVAAGEFVSVLGPSGCGKSTLLRIVAGLMPADEGAVRIGGRAAVHAVAEKQIGFVPQEPALLPWRTVLDNVRLPLRVNRRAGAGRHLREPEALLRSFGLGESIDRFPHQLSGGMQQRVAIARAFAFDPAILLMDEPFSALDELNREQQRASLLDFWQSHRKSVMFVTHSVPEAIMLSDRVVLMASRPGRIVEIVDVDLPRPRTPDILVGGRFRELEARVRGRLRTVMAET